MPFGPKRTIAYTILKANVGRPMDEVVELLMKDEKLGYAARRDLATRCYNLTVQEVFEATGEVVGHRRQNATHSVKSREFSVVIERDADGFYVASVPALPGCHTQARSLDELMTNVREAIEVNLEVLEDDSPELEFIGVQRISVAA